MKSGPSWPTVAHMWHMGGHVFAQLGRHADAAWQQEASARVDHAHMIRDRVLPDQIHNFAHNNEWLVRSLRHAGRSSEAVALAKNMVELPRHPIWNRLDKGGCSASYGRRRLLETLEIYERWDELATLCDTMYLEPSERAGDEVLRAWTLGKAHAYLGNAEGVEAALAELSAGLAEAKRERIEEMEAAEEAAVAEGKSKSKVRDAMAEVIEEHARHLEELRETIEALEALRGVLIEGLVGEPLKEALETLGERRFRKTHLARLYAEAELFEKAEELARAAAENRELQAYEQANLAYVLERAGKREEALEAFGVLREYSGTFDLSAPVFERLAPLAEAGGFPADWRVPYVPGEDVGERVALDELGPPRWSPPVAPDWTAPDAYGRWWSQEDFEGRPYILIHFLGFGCLHCVEQLEAFAPQTEAFREAGIELVAIGTNTTAEILESLEGQEDYWPFPILSDPAFTTFKDYRAYDDFEAMELHGTYLIDSDGRMRWQDISYEPFTDHEFLLAESVRLLGLPDPEPWVEASAKREEDPQPTSAGAEF